MLCRKFELIPIKIGFFYEFLFILDIPAPTLPQLLKVLKPMRSRWAGLADQLDVSRPAGGGGDDLTCLGSVLREWMNKNKGDHYLMWREIKEAVIEMEENDVLIELLKIMENVM